MPRRSSQGRTSEPEGTRRRSSRLSSKPRKDLSEITTRSPVQKTQPSPPSTSTRSTRAKQVTPKQSPKPRPSPQRRSSPKKRTTPTRGSRKRKAEEAVGEEPEAKAAKDEEDGEDVGMTEEDSSVAAAAAPQTSSPRDEDGGEEEEVDLGPKGDAVLARDEERENIPDDAEAPSPEPPSPEPPSREAMEEDEETAAEQISGSTEDRKPGASEEEGATEPAESKPIETDASPHSAPEPPAVSSNSSPAVEQRGSPSPPATREPPSKSDAVSRVSPVPTQKPSTLAASPEIKERAHRAAPTSDAPVKSDAESNNAAAVPVTAGPPATETIAPTNGTPSPPEVNSNPTAKLVSQGERDEARSVNPAPPPAIGQPQTAQTPPRISVGQL